MTVQELIDLLSKADKNARVEIFPFGIECADYLYPYEVWISAKNGSVLINADKEEKKEG